MAARYCADCDIAWPNDNAYAKCPGCSRTIPIIMDITSPWGPNRAKQGALDIATARDLREAFERFCEERDAPNIEAEALKFRAQLDQFVGVPE